MDREMLLYQARQDFVDIHHELYAGKQVSLRLYEQLATDLKGMDEHNFEFLLHFTQRTDRIPIAHLWESVSAHIEQLKQRGEWSQAKDSFIQWHQNKLTVLSGAERNE